MHLLLLPTDILIIFHERTKNFKIKISDPEKEDFKTVPHPL
jgi:hypothetical protein